MAGNPEPPYMLCRPGAKTACLVPFVHGALHIVPDWLMHRWLNVCQRDPFLISLNNKILFDSTSSKYWSGIHLDIGIHSWLACMCQQIILYSRSMQSISWYVNNEFTFSLDLDTVKDILFLFQGSSNLFLIDYWKFDLKEGW